MKTPKQIEHRIAQLKRKIERLTAEVNRPQQVPGPFVTGRSGYRLGKALDRENTRRANAFRDLQKAKTDLAFWTSRLEGYRSGEYHLDGRPRADAPSRQKQQAAEDTLAAFMRTQIKPGDTLAVAMNPQYGRITVKRVNFKSVTAESGTRWSYSEVLLMDGDQPMSDARMRELLRAYLENGEHDA